MSLTNEQYDTIMREYDEIRFRNAELTEKKVRALYEKFPELQAWENRAVTLKARKVRMMLDGASQTDIDNLEDEATMLLVKRVALLETNGLSEADFEPICDCPDCKDTGYVYDAKGNRSKCHCFKAREINLLYDQSGIKSFLEKENFSKLSLDYRTGDDLEHLKGAVKICREFIGSFDNEHRNLVLSGTVGTGKSFLSCCIAHDLLESGHSVIYLSAVSLFDKLAGRQFRKDEEESGTGLSELYDCDLLVIDDLGTELTNSFVASSLFSLINERELRGKSTIISTNLDLAGIKERYSDRVLSRLTGNYTFLKLTGPDMRTLLH